MSSQIKATTSSPCTAIRINDGLGLLFVAEYDPVAEPGFTKYFPSY